VPFFDRNLNMYRASTGGYFATKEAAAAAEAGASGAPAAAALLRPMSAPDVADAAGRVNTGDVANRQDFFGEGAWNPSGQKPITPTDPNDLPNPRNPQGMSNNDYAKNRAFVTAKARATTNTNTGAGGGLGSTGDAAVAARQVNAPQLTTGFRPGVVEHFNNGQAAFDAMRHTPEEQAALDAQGLGTKLYDKTTGRVIRDGRDPLGSGNNLGMYVENGREYSGIDSKRVGYGATTGAALGGAVGGPVGAGFGAAIGGLYGAGTKAGGSGGTLVPTEGTGVPVYDQDNNIIGYQGGSAGVNATGPGTVGSTTPGGLPNAPGALPNYAPAASGTGTTSAGAESTNAETEQAKGDYSAENAENETENTNLWAHANDLAEGVGHDNALGDEARGYQREGLQQQRMLLDKMLGYDPNQYAAQFSDQALARQIALARSSGGGAAAQQAGIFAAMDQAPALYAEGARQASSLENQRLTQAEAAAKSFGELGTMTRGQDEARSAFESSLSLDIAKQVGALTQGQVTMNEADSQRFAEIWMDFAKLQSVYAGMSSAEQLAWWQKTTAERGQDKQFEAIVAGLKAGGAVSEKDLVGGLFQLGGGVISSYGQIQAAQAKAA
jgi:hypothetical protein